VKPQRMVVSRDVLLLCRGSRNIATTVRADGYRVSVVMDRDQLCREALGRHFDIVLVDVVDSTAAAEIACDLRLHGMVSPILLLTDEMPDTRSSGAECLIGTFEMPELLARLRAIFSRGESHGPEREFYFGDVRVDVTGTEIVRRGRSVTVAAREFQLLTYLLRNAGVTLSRERLLQDVWGYREAALTRTVDVHIASLRRKLECDPKHPRYIVTVKGLGYKFAEPVRSEHAPNPASHDNMAYA
jgi:two-component system alkaline phosphatase synthesis response regulator PhoP